MTVDRFVQHRDPGGISPHQETRLLGGARTARAAEREVSRRNEPARDAEPNDLAFAFCGDQPVHFSERERNYGIYVLGKTGSGKTVALQNAALLDIAAGKSVVFIDPHGDAARTIMDSIPSSCAEKVCYLDLSRIGSVAWNPLTDIPTTRAAVAAMNLTDAIKDIWPDTWGERLANFLRNGFHLLIERGDANLRDLPRLYYDKEHRARLTASIKDPALRDFWRGEFPSYDERQRREAQGPILNRIGQFLAIPQIRSIVCARSSTLDLATAIDNGYVIVVNLSKGTTGRTPSALFGSLIASSIKTTLMARESVSADERPPLALFADEFHNYGTLAWTEMLSECRKYGLQLTLAHQFAGQLNEDVLAAILGNVDTLLIFRVGIDDALRLNKNFTRNNIALAPAELSEQQPYRAFLKRGTNHYRIETVPSFPSLQRYYSNIRSSDRRFSSRVV